MLSEIVSSSEGMPESITNLISSLVRIIIGVVGFIICFFGSLAILRLICKIIRMGVRKFPFKKKNRLIGVLVGLLNGICISYVVCVPITGLVVQLNKLASIEMNGEKLIDIDTSELGLDAYEDSTLGKIYVKTGSWFFELLTTDVDKDGNKVSLEATTSAAVAVTGITNELQTLSEIDMSEGLNDDNVKQLKDSLTKIDEIKNDLSKDSKELINDVLSDFIGEAELDIPDDFDITEINFTAAGNAIESAYEYSKDTTKEPDIDTIVDGLAENLILLDTFGDDTIVTVEEKDKEAFTTAIDSKDISAEDKDRLKKLFGLIE